MGRRHVAARAALALGLLGGPFAAPALAHDGTQAHRMNWGGDAPADGERLYATDFVTARIQFQDGVSKWRIEMRPENGGAAVSFCEKAVAGKVTDTTVRCNWDTRRYGDMTALGENAELAGAPPAPNGRFVVTVTAWNNGEDYLFQPDIPPNVAHTLPTRTVVVENPVSAPTAVGRSFDSRARRVTVTWATNPEPDIEKYVVQEKLGSGTWQKVGERPASATSFERDLTAAGTYHYRVAAVRPEVSQSSWTEAPPLEVEAIPEAPAPTSGGDAGDGGSDAPPPGDPGVFIPEDSTTTTSAPRPPGPAPTAGRPATGSAPSLFNRPSTNTFRPTPGTSRATTPTTEYDPGYSETLPYALPQKGVEEDGAGEDEELAGGEEEEPSTMTKVISIPRPRNPRDLLVPMAGGLALFVFAMQVTVAIRRRPAMANAEDDFADWSGF